MKEIVQDCPACGGTGSETGTTPIPGGDPVPFDNQCTQCAGTGKLPQGQLSDDLISFLEDMSDKVNDIMDKCNDIKERLDEL